ncbi:MAG: CNP1-like family protein [Pseudomonadota bacterium]
MITRGDRTSANRRATSVCTAALMALVVCTADVHGQAADKLPGETDGTFIERVPEDPNPWKEGAVTLPPAPRDRDLLPFRAGSGKLDYFIDRRSLSLGDDEIVRYTVVIRSATATNTFYEGIRCETREFQTYAHSTKGRKFRPRTQPQWRLIKFRHGPMNFRYALLDGIVCDDFSVLPLRPKEVVARLKGLTEDDTIRGQD